MPLPVLTYIFSYQKFGWKFTTYTPIYNWSICKYCKKTGRSTKGALEAWQNQSLIQKELDKTFSQTTSTLSCQTLILLGSITFKKANRVWKSKFFYNQILVKGTFSDEADCNKNPFEISYFSWANSTTPSTIVSNDSSVCI